MLERLKKILKRAKCKLSEFKDFFTREQKYALLVCLCIIVSSIIVIINNNQKLDSAYIASEEALNYKIIVDNTQEGEILLTCTIDNVENKECNPMVINGTFSSNNGETTISSDDVELSADGDVWSFNLSGKIYSSTTTLDQKFISLFLSDNSNNKRYEYKLLISFEIDEESIAKLQEAEKIEEEKKKEEERLLAEQKQKEAEEKAAKEEAERPMRELREKVRVGCLDSDSFKTRAYGNFSSFVKENRIMDYINVSDPQYTGYGNWYLMRGTMSVTYKEDNSFWKDYTLTISCLYEIDTGESKSYSWDEDYSEEKIQELEAKIIDDMAYDKGFKTRQVQDTSTGVCKDGTKAYGSRHAKGAANSCYRHGGWR